MYILSFEEDMVFTLKDNRLKEEIIPDSELRPIPTP